MKKDCPLVSIFVLMYNKLEYTRVCIENIYRYTEDIDYELILVDNGSTDGTREYLKALPDFPPKRIIRIDINNPIYAGTRGLKASRGKYIAFVSNDIIVTKNWLKNLLFCMESDDHIGFAVPCTNCASNLQQIPVSYNGIDEMHRFAGEYNVSDPRKWEERVRIIPYLTLYRKDMIEVIGYGDPLFKTYEFSDDDFSFRARRAGYKLIFCGDTFVHHFGSITNREAQSSSNSLEAGRKIFSKKYKGLDAWNDVVYDLNMISLFTSGKKRSLEQISILGIDARCGATILQMKNKLRLDGIFNAFLHTYVQNPIYYTDLMTICETVKIGEANDLLKNYSGRTFDYIVLDEPLTSYQNSYELLRQMVMLLKSGGHILLSLVNMFNYDNLISAIYGANTALDGITYIDINSLNIKIKQMGLNINKSMYEQLVVDDKSQKCLQGFADMLSKDNDIKQAADKLTTLRYFLDIVKS